MKKIILLSCFFCCSIVTQAQSYISPKYSVDGTVNALASKGDTLIVGGDFNNVGIYTGGGALISTSSDKPNLTFPKMIGSVYASTSDGKGGYYIYGSYHKENENNTLEGIIEHILPDFTFEKGFSLKVDALFGVDQILYHNGILFIGGRYIESVGGQPAGDLTAIDVKTKKVLSWIPQITRTYLGGVSYLKINKNTLYFTGGFSEVGTEKRNSVAAIEIGTGKIKSWNPTIGSISAIEFYNNRIIIGGGFSDEKFENHACAFVDTLNGQNLEYIFNQNNLYWAAGVQKMSISGDTLFTYSSGTFDTRVTAINLKDKNKFLWTKYFNMIASPSGMIVSNGKVFLGGNYFETIYKTNLTNDEENKEKDIKGIVALDTKSGELKDWFPAPNNTMFTMTLQGKDIFIGGQFSHLNSIERNCLLMIDTKKEQILPLNIKLSYSSVSTLKIIDNTLYVGGSFNNINNQNHNASILSLDIKNNQLLPWNVPNVGSITTIEANEKYVFIGGDFAETSGLKRANLLAIDRKTGSFTNWNPNPNYRVLSLHIAKNNLYVGGDFTAISGKNRNYLASFDLNTLNISNWNPKPNSTVSALHSSGNTIWAGGSFYKFNETNVNLFVGLDPNSGEITQKPNFIQANGYIRSIYVKGRYAMIGGDFTLNNSGTCGDFIMYDLLAKNTIPPISLCQDFSYSDYYGSRIQSLVMIKDNLYVGGQFLQVNAKANASNIGIIQYTKGFFEPKITDYFPKSGGNGGDVTINFYGDLIDAGMKVRLVAAGLPDIVVPDSMIRMTGDYALKVKFDLRQKKIGLYSIKISSVNGIEYIIDKGFNIEAFKKAETLVQVVGPDAIRVGRPTTFLVQLNNEGNCNSNGIPVFLFITGNTKVKFLNNFSGLNGQKLDTIMYSNRDSMLGNKIKNKAYWLLIPELMAGSTKNIEIEITPLTNNEDIYVTAIANSPLFASPMPAEKSDCHFAIAKVVLGAVLSNIKDEIIGDAFQCLDGTISTFNNGLNLYRNWGSNNDIDIMDFGYGLASTIYSCTATASIFVPQLRVVKVLDKAFDVLDNTVGSAINGAQAGMKCKDNQDLDGNSSSKKTRSVNSFDPNDKIGVGINAKHYITGNEPMQYGIRFENFATATAAAQYVKVIDTLDRSKVDLSTFQLNFFRFGNRTINVSPGQKKRTEFVDMRPQKNLILKIQAGLNDTTGVFTTEFTSLDPRTMKLTEDAILGFLPPNKTFPEGEGSIYYTISTKTGLPNKTEIKNKAYIYFDENPVIPTLIWSNTIDKLAPESKVETLSEITSDTTFTVRWNGKDGEAGIKSYNVYYAVNNTAFKPLILNTNSSQYTFTGKIDSTYSFYSVAIDSVKNMEIVPNTFDTKTTIRKILAIEPKQDDGFRVYPNPTKELIFIESPEKKKINRISLFDISGREIAIDLMDLNDGKYVINLIGKPSGVYLLEIEYNKLKVVRKIHLQ